MNNLLLFREISGVQRKEITFFLHTSIHVYHYYEKDIITIPENIKRMLAKLYDVTETELFNSDGVISENTMEKLRYFSTLDEEKRKKKLSLNLSEGEAEKMNFEQIEQIKHGERYCPSDTILSDKEEIDEDIFILGN